VRTDGTAGDGRGTPDSADPASRALGIRFDLLGAGTCTARMVVRADMLNAQATCHGGIVFALADSAVGHACNFADGPAVAAGASIEFLAPAYAGDELTATATSRWQEGRGAVYDVLVSNQAGQLIAMLRCRSRRVGERGRAFPGRP
jgi:acyl-CoA thioesterase